uniref:Nitric oxide associated 1 n=1 Tax=Oncorhynchus mykiss TaxID=8022 RepID=A0A8K9XNY7_ONCMY
MGEIQDLGKNVNIQGKCNSIEPENEGEFVFLDYIDQENTHKDQLHEDKRLPLRIDTCCNGCGYLPSEKYKLLLEEKELKKGICHRCYLLTHHQKTLTVKMSKEEYLDIVSRVKSEKALVLFIVDLLDIPYSIAFPVIISKISRFGSNEGVWHRKSNRQRLWKYNGDVYLAGMANTGKSTLFNTLLESDYGKSRASDVIHKATISPWPGKMELCPACMLSTVTIRYIMIYGTLFFKDRTLFNPSPDVGLTLNELKDAHWLYDTPGIMKDVLNLLTEQVKVVVPTQAIVHNGAHFCLYDIYITNCWFLVLASNRVSIHITSVDKADRIYQKHAGQILLGLKEPMKEFPPLVSKEFELKGQGFQKASPDIKMSSVGWVRVTGVEGNRFLLRAHAPEGTGLSLSSPPLLPNFINPEGRAHQHISLVEQKMVQDALF